MLRSGWIFPDGTEFSTREHEQVVADFIEGLKEDEDLYYTLKHSLKHFFVNSHSPTDLLCDYAIQVLGWIKVGSLSVCNITYGGYFYQPQLVARYLSRNFYDDNRRCEEKYEYAMHKSQQLILLSCNWENVINLGRKIRASKN